MERKIGHKDRWPDMLEKCQIKSSAVLCGQISVFGRSAKRQVVVCPVGTNMSYLHENVYRGAVQMLIR